MPQVTILCGVFYEEDGNLMVADEDHGTVRVADVLQPHVGQNVTVVLHHCPPEPPDPSRWGGGCCLLQPAGFCPVGHHERPSFLYEAKATGKLVSGEHWSIQGEGGEIPLRLDWLVGHSSQIVLSALPDIEKLRAHIEQDMQNPTVEGLQARLQELRDLLSAFNSEKDNL